MTSSHSELIKPVAVLSHTDWLTDARDAEVGMAIHFASGDVVREYRIIDVGCVGDDVMLGYDRDGYSLISAAAVNASREVVVG